MPGRQIRSRHRWSAPTNRPGSGSAWRGRRPCRFSPAPRRRGCAKRHDLFARRPRPRPARWPPLRHSPSWYRARRGWLRSAPSATGGKDLPYSYNAVLRQKALRFEVRSIDSPAPGYQDGIPDLANPGPESAARAAAECGQPGGTGQVRERASSRRSCFTRRSIRAPCANAVHRPTRVCRRSCVSRIPAGRE